MTRFIFLRPCAFIWATILGFLVVTGLRAERALTSFSLRTQVASAAGSRALLNFTVEGTEAKTVLLRAVGPTLGSFGVPGVLPDPRLVLYNASGAVLTSNAGWGGLAAISAANARVGAFVLPTASKDAALLLTLGAGTYCAEVESVGGTDGVVLLEIYDADTAASSRLTYLAVQARLASVREQAAAGFSVSGSGGPDVIVRALGPGLAAAGVAETLGDPQLNVFNGVGQLVGSSQDWFPMTGLVEGGRAAGLLPLVGRDAGTVLTAAAAGAYSVVVSGAQDTTGVFLLEVACVDPNRSTQVAPALLQPPRDLVGASGGTLSIAAPAIGRPELAYQWRRNGVAIPGATTSLLTVNNFTAASVGAYTVAVSNAAGAIVSAPFNVTLGQPVVPPAAPVVLIPPISQSVGSGANVVFTVAASGQPAPSFQWLFNGQPIPGATLPTLTLTAVTPASAGDYSVRLTNASGSVVSTAARLIVAPDIAPKVYFGSFAGATGEFALLTRPDGTGALVGLQKSPPIGFVGRTLAINTFGSPSGRVDWLAVPLTRLETSVQGVVATNQVILSIGGGVGSLTADTAPITLGPLATVAGFYEAGVVGGSGRAYAIVAADGQMLVVVSTPTLLDGGRGTVDALGNFGFTAQNFSRIEGNIHGQLIRLTVRPASGTAALALGGGESSVRTETEKLINVSTRSRTSAGAGALAAGFVITGVEAKTVLVRGIGPGLGAFGITDALAAARLEVAHNGATIAVGNDWGTAADAPAIAAAATRVGAFPLGSGSRDASLLLRLDPGAYTATLTGQGGTSGVGLVEVYDASDAPVAKTDRIINVSSRAMLASDDSLIAGFVVSGAVPKRVLVRGIGPGLAQFGLGGVLARPRVAIYSGETVVATNERWATSPDTNAIMTAAEQVGAFALPVTTADAALLVHLEPGAYTARVSSVTGESGLALVEVYEVP